MPNHTSLKNSDLTVWAPPNIIKDSSYRGPLSYEITMRHTPFTFIDPETQKPGTQPEANQKAYLVDAHERCERFAKMVGE